MANLVIWDVRGMQQSKRYATFRNASKSKMLKGALRFRIENSIGVTLVMGERPFTNTEFTVYDLRR